MVGAQPVTDPVQHFIVIHERTQKGLFRFDIMRGSIGSGVVRMGEIMYCHGSGLNEVSRRVY